MTSFRTWLPMATGLMMLGIGAAVISTPAVHGASAAPPQNVRVVNTDVDPVPTLATGTTPISGSVSIAGTPSVTGTITVGNPTSSPVPVRAVDNPANQAFQAEDVLTLDAGVSNNIIVGPAVPAGKRLVIEHVSATGLLPAGAKLLRAEIGASLNGSFVFHRLVPALDGSIGTIDVFAMSTPMRMYADGGTSLHLLAVRDAFSIGSPASVDFSVSGYLVDMP